MSTIQTDLDVFADLTLLVSSVQRGEVTMQSMEKEKRAEMVINGFVKNIDGLLNTGFLTAKTAFGFYAIMFGAFMKDVEAKLDKAIDEGVTFEKEKTLFLAIENNENLKKLRNGFARLEKAIK